MEENVVGDVNLDRLVLVATVLGALALVGMATGFADAGGSIAFVGEAAALLG